MAADATQPENHTEPRFGSWLLTKPITLGLAGVIILLTVFYVEEDLRGKLAWKRYRRQLKVENQVLDWNTFVPPPIPDSENIFSAPKMKDWFVKGGSGSVTMNMGFWQLTKYLKERHAPGLAEVVVVSIDATNGLPESDVVLRYEAPVLECWRNDSPSSRVEAASQIIPLIVMDSVPLADAIRNLATQGEIKYTWSPEVAQDMAGNRPQPTVTIRWENVSARHALKSLLANHGLALVEKQTTGTALIKKVDSNPRVYVDADVTEKLRSLISTAAGTNGVHYANGSQGIRLMGLGSEPKPFRILLRANQIPSPDEVKNFFPARVSVAISDTNTYDISLAPQQVTAADYIAWNNQLQPNFALIREGLKRPSVRINGDYSQPFSQPMVNFVAIRVVAQTLAQRAQCYMLLGEPEKALQELTLLHDMNRLLEGKPVTLVSAMIETSVTGLYTDTIADGFRLGVWREPQLAALQTQLGEVNLTPQLRSAFLAERAGICRVLETQSAAKIHQSFAMSGSQNLWQRLQDPQMLLASVAPRGWNQQNMVVVATVDQKYLDCFDADRQIFSPRKSDSVLLDMEKTFNHMTPMNFLAGMGVPNFGHACKTLARTQTLVNEANVACAVERYRAAHGNFPETLELLIPDFIQRLPADVIGGRPLHYRRKGSDKFLLYSVGWNETDDGGVAVRRSDGSVVLEQGDWVWDPLQEKR
jgi:hypothetical protein